MTSPASYSTTTATTTTASRVDTALAILRIIVGIIFIAHGAQKLFVFGIAGVAGSFGQMGVPLPGIAAPIITFIELLGGLALVLGAFTRVAALALAAEMLGAILFVHLKGGFFLPAGAEYALLQLGSCLALVLAGAGAYSVDHSLAGRRAHAAVTARA
jgi:putative oxidoreductase